jgi:FkbM family methyltransferase
MMELLKLFKFVWQHPLNAGGRLAALLRVVKWQIASRLFAGPLALPFVESTMLFASRGTTGATGNWYCGLHEFRDMAFVLHLLRPGEHFADVGANIGSYSILAAGGAGARVTAVEPIPATASNLERNILLNHLSSQVRVCRLGLSDVNGSLKFSLDLDTVNHVLAPGESLPGIEVPVIRLDELIGDDVPVLIKIDVEGFEREVLLGADKTLADAGLLAVIMETNGSGARYGVADHELIVIMARYGFTPFGYDPFERRLVGTSVADGNTIFVRDKSRVEGRITKAKHFQLVNGKI